MLPRVPLPSSHSSSTQENGTANTTTNGDATKATATAPQTMLLLAAGPTGALSSLRALSETSYRRLSSLAGQLANTLPHAAGLNPKAHRMPPSATQTFTARTAPGIGDAGVGTSIVDGAVLARWGELPSGKRGEVAGRAGFAGGKKSSVEEVRGELEGVLGWSGLAYF